MMNRAAATSFWNRVATLVVRTLLLLLVVTTGDNSRLQLLVMAQPANMPPHISSSDWLHELPDTGAQWHSLSDTTEFQPSLRAKDQSKQDLFVQVRNRFLEEEAKEEQGSMYVDSRDTYYAGYQQAWRYLGFYIDCNPRQYAGGGDHHRSLAENKGSGCQRYLLWAAYVDLNYRGGKVSEYAYYNVYKDVWDTSACEKNSGGRCAKMDCHEADTSWELLGYFKEANYGDWFEQLFKHEGYCIWNNKDAFYFMYDNSYSWPEGCTQTSASINGNSLYYDLKPLPEANMTIGLYTDSRCTVAYTGSQYTVANLAGKNGNNDHHNRGRNLNGQNKYGASVGLITGSYVNQWNYNMAIFKVCVPCRASDLESGDNFQCYDAAGYTNVNQCMKFRTKTYMEYASYDEVMMAAQQDSLLGVKVDGTSYGQYLESALQEQQKSFVHRPFFAISVSSFVVTLAFMARVIWWSRSRQSGSSLSEPLVENNVGVIA